MLSLSKETLQVLKNFSAINQNVYISKDADYIATVNQQETVFATYSALTERFPTEIRLYDLNEFLSIISLNGNENAVLDFPDDRRMTITSSNNKYRCGYYFASIDVIKFPKKQINMPDPFVSFMIDYHEIDMLQKAARTLTKQAIQFSYDASVSKTNLDVRVFDPQTNGNDFSTSVDLSNMDQESTEDKFNFVFSLKTLSALMPNESWQVQFAAKGSAKIARFSSVNGSTYGENGLSYYAGVDSTSSIG